MNSIIPYGQYYIVCTLLYPTHSIVPYRQFFPEWTVLFLKDSFLPEAMHCFVRSKNRFHRKDSNIPFCQYYTVLTVILLTESIEWFAQNLILKFCFFFLKILYFCPN